MVGPLDPTGNAVGHMLDAFGRALAANIPPRGSVIDALYDLSMQIAVVLRDDQVEALDRLVPSEFSSRAEAVRTAVAAWIAERRATAIDDRYRAAYAENPSSVDDVDSGRLRKGQMPPAGVWDDLDW